MSSGLLAALQVQLACQLITPVHQGIENLTLNTPLKQQSIVLPNGYTAFFDIGVAMKYFANDLTWNLARQHCITEGGNLAVIDSFEKSKYANDLRKSNPRGPFLGIHKLYDNVQWVSVKTGFPLAFIPWKSGLNRSTEAPSCTALYGDLGGRVGPFDCNRAWSYVCEIPLSQECKTTCVQSSQEQTNRPAANGTIPHTDTVTIAAN